MELKSFLPPVCIKSTTSDTWYIIAGGIWNVVDRFYDWSELESMWIKDPIYTKIENKVINSIIKTYEVKGSKDNVYKVVNNSGVWNCSCPAFGFSRRTTCKHIDSVKK